MPKKKPATKKATRKTPATTTIKVGKRTVRGVPSAQNIFDTILSGKNPLDL